MSEEQRENLAEEVTDEDEDFITLEFDDGTAVDCFIIGVFDLNDKEYIALAPDDGTDDVYIYGYKDNDDDTFEILDIDDEDEFDAAVAELDKLMDAED
ncbi:DUF1292 domain-containing protein [Mobilibacterium timonense]|uniref:DUF1292 domain-containing protein n=1 Tax=Mobilibacterium timonense TaxID=1871012 RepID=UPI0009863C31|nr:DUF1292 domain-containing protein [Mobilibacterium timonense]MBM6991281.1 DUF1292 domain-containing protein [Mobilibacterium timonense]